MQEGHEDIVTDQAGSKWAHKKHPFNEALRERIQRRSRVEVDTEQREDDVTQRTPRGTRSEREGTPRGYNGSSMSATGTIQKLRTESTQLSKALLLALRELERGRDESSVQKRKNVVASILSDAVVEECIVRELHESGQVSKAKSRFSAVETGIRSYSSFGITDGELTRKSALPSEIAKRRAKGS